VSKSGFAKGLRLRHYGEIIHAKFLSEYPAIVDKVRVTMITDPPEVERRLAAARRVYEERNERLGSMTDESVDTFYSCLLCQSFAPDHVCVITPERLGLCGAYNWLDGKAAHEIDETGPNQPVKKGECLDPVRGIWRGVNEYVYPNSHKAVREFCAYSIMDRPMTSCGCFEAICAYVPECNGIMVVSREHPGDTPVGMTFSTLAGAVGGGRQTPGFIGVGKVFLTSRKFLFAEGGHRRLVWMPQELKKQLGPALHKLFTEWGYPNLLDQIADETVGVDPREIRAFLEKVGHPALAMPDLSLFAEGAAPAPAAVAAAPAVAPLPAAARAAPAPAPAPAATPTARTLEFLAQNKDRLAAELAAELSSRVDSDAVADIIGLLYRKLTGEGPAAPAPTPADSTRVAPTAAARLAAVTSFAVPKERCEVPIWTVKLGATKAEGGTRGRTYTVGGATCMPFHLWEGEMPHRPLVAMEVFDAVSEKYPAVLRAVYGGLLDDPPAMARRCVEQYGADLISVRLDGTHPEKGDCSPADAVRLVQSVLAAVDVPLIVTGHNHFDKHNEVMKAVAAACAGENLLLNWVEQNNYRTIAGAALAYGHALVAQSPIDVNIGKQTNILLFNMDIRPGQVVMDPLTGAAGYGIEYTYSVMERMRLTGLNGDKMLAGPLLVAPGPECAKIKELRAPESACPAWGELARRAAAWELATATPLLYAGADILILYHPEAAMALKRLIGRLLDGRGD